MLPELAVPLEHLALGAAALVSIGGLAFANGGYFPVSWGWAASGLLWLAAIALALSLQVRLTRLESTFLASLGALTGWIFLSTLWTQNVTATVLEGERALVYVGAGLTAVVLVRRATSEVLLGSMWAATTIACGWGVATRLFPEQLGSFDSVAGYRLSEPLGYWNALGIFAALGTLLAVGLAARSGPVLRCLAGASTVVTVLALYFTFSRGGWMALFVGAAAAIAVDPRRLQLITTGLALLPWPALAVLLASRSDALTHQTASLRAAVKDGHGLAAVSIGLMVAAALVALALDALESSLSVSERAQRIYAGTLVVVLAAALIVVFGRYGSPETLARKAYNSFNTPPRTDGSDLNQRLFNLSGTGRNQQWHAAWEDARHHPWLGSGAGTFDVYWFAHRPIGNTVHDAHNLYLETLAELGPVGELLLVALLGTPLLALRRARSAPLASAAAAAYVAFVAHAAVDWDWEMPAVTLVALFCGVSLLASARDEWAGRLLGPRLRGGALAATVVLGAFAVLGLLGNSAVSASTRAANSGNFGRAQSQARRAIDLAPWSSAGWRKLGEAQYQAGRTSAARASFRKAVAKEPRDWTLWLELATASRGRERAQALAQARRLNPRGPELAAVKK